MKQICDVLGKKKEIFSVLNSQKEHEKIRHQQDSNSSPLQIILMQALYHWRMKPLTGPHCSKAD